MHDGVGMPFNSFLKTNNCSNSIGITETRCVCSDAVEEIQGMTYEGDEMGKGY